MIKKFSRHIDCFPYPWALEQEMYCFYSSCVPALVSGTHCTFNEKLLIAWIRTVDQVMNVIKNGTETCFLEGHSQAVFSLMSYKSVPWSQSITEPPNWILDGFEA